MGEIAAHPIAVATYAAGLGLAIAGVRAIVQLFARMTRLEDKFDTLADDLRHHMEQEGENVARLEALIRQSR